MNKQSLNKLKNLILVILSIGLIICGTLLYQNDKENQRHFKHLLNFFYIELSPTIDNINVLLSDEDMDMEEYTARITVLENRLTKLNTYLDLGDATLPYDILDQPTFALYAHYENIAEVEDKKTYYQGLKEVLLFVKEEMYSEETGKENPNLTVDEFNKIIKEGTEMYRYLLL